MIIIIIIDKRTPIIIIINKRTHHISTCITPNCKAASIPQVSAFLLSIHNMLSY